MFGQSVLKRRFIPAGAGNAIVLMIRPALMPVHPRGCGERHGDGGYRLKFDGSSPRVRGTPYVNAGWFVFPRFIPAGAGNAIWLNTSCL